MEHSKQNLRLFSLIFSFAQAVISIRFSKADYVLASSIFLGVSILSLTIGIIRPHVMKPVHRTLKLILSSVIYLLLGIVFYCVFTPISVILKTSKQDIMDLKIDQKCTSYWSERKKRIIEPESLERQY
jgi:hypothetical protein